MLRVFGDWDESYQALPKWMNILQLTNPGTKIVWKTIPLGGIFGNVQFMRVFGHLGQVLKGSSIADQLYKLMEESHDSWSWFLIALRHHVTQREGICLISDRHAGINAAVRNPSVGWSPPHAQHRYCLRHVVSNFNDKFKNKVLKELAYRAGCQHQPRKYERYMEELKRLDEKSVAWFSKLDTQKWTQAYDLGYRAEIRARMAVGDVYTTYAIEKFRRAKAKASGHTVTIFHRIHETFEVITALHGFHMDKGRNKQVVKLNEVEKYYRLDAYASCYAPEFNLVPHESYWPYHCTMEPGPLDPIVLHGQATHRSFVAWTGVDSKELHCRRREAIFHRTSVLDGRIIPLLQQAGSYGLTPGDTDIDGQRLHLTWLSQSFPTLAPDADEESIQRYTRAYILQLIGGFLFSGKSSDKVHLMFLPLLEDFEVAVMGMGEFPFIAPHRLRIASHDDQLPPPPLAIRWRYEFRTTSISMHVLAQYRHHLDRLTADQIIWQPYVDDMNVGLPDYCTAGKDIWCTISPLICFHIIEWHRPDRVDMMLIGLLDMETTFDVGALGVSILLERDGYRLCTTVLEAIHEMDRLNAPFSVGATTQLQPPSGGVRPTRRGPRTREIRHTPVVARVRPSTDISLPPHHQPTSSITRSGGSVRTRGRGAHTRGIRHTSVLRDAPSTDISLPPVQETLITPMEVPSTPPVVPLVASSPPSIEATLVHEELVHIANDDQQGKKTNRGRGHGRGRGRRRGRGAHEGLHVSPIEPIVEHAHHRRPLRKRKASSCGTH
ncbi:Serine/threonine-protein phosphatase 7 long form-like [Vitis vinifera]|uniref:Serine/threonine-protein phosphatase 7 long form-like n=1 Tax=Vitis vinifera TaxID=29760 RepID=A0A438DE04_VITVI|nr:Serine/threonine-protein phosphatase 7 long form-like [Vitis vinifera]